MAKKGASTRLWNRSLAIMLIIIILGFGTAAGRLFYLQTYMSEELQQKAVNQQMTATSLSSKRGSIYDRNGNILAQSITVWKVVLEPATIKTDDDRRIVAKELSELLGLDEEKVFKQTQEDNYYSVVKTGVETDVKDKVLELKDQLSEEHGIPSCFRVIEDYKRYYTNENFAGDIIGFVGSDDQGLSGIEYQYDDYLTGKAGRLVKARNAAGQEMPYEYEQKVEANDGYNLTLTIDQNVQSIMEKYVRETIKEFRVANRGCAIMMDVKTGAIIGFACEGSFNPNEPFKIADEEVAKAIEALPEDEQNEATIKAQAKQWRNKGVSDTYVPGSVFKMVTASAILSEGINTKDNKYECSGAYAPFEGSSPISCWLSGGHGTQTLEEALCNSCNPAFMQMGTQLGREKFYEYYVSFGFSEKTGIDLPGESDDVFFSKSNGVCGMDLTDLAVASFGQNFKITPIQMLSACAAIANDGKLMKPYVVSNISDSKGNVVKTTEPTVRHQAISKEVADIMCQMLQNNVISGGGTNGYIPGYRVCGKTGTSQKIIDEDGNPCNDYVGSFCGFAPADDPEVALICYFDTPDPEINYYGSAVAGPCFRNILSEVLPYLGVEKKYSDAEMAELDTTTDAYVGMEADYAKTILESSKLKAVVVGEGNVVVAQNPPAYTSIPKDGTVVLYTDSEAKIEQVSVPDFKGKTLAEVNSMAAEAGLNLCIKGSRVSDGGSYAQSQDLPPGKKVDPYTVVTVTFNQNNSIM